MLLVDAPVGVTGDDDYFGIKLSRSEALTHERLPEVWEIVDFVVATDPTVTSYVHGSNG